MTVPSDYLLPTLPEGLEGLVELALDLRWSWNHAADKLWKYMDPELWSMTANPWLMLQTVKTDRLKALATDSTFRGLLNELVEEHREAIGETTWFEQSYPQSTLKAAYFSMEYGLSEALPIYSGGLGILAGDYLKTASDLGVTIIGVGLLYQQGYFRQAVDARGDQTEFYPYNDPGQLPVMPVRDRNGEWLRIRIDFPGGILWLRAWEAVVGRVKLYLLDSNDPINSPPDRGITSELYGGGPELRLQQEIVLGIGGWRLLDAMGIQPEVCHLNEGHAALAVVERAHSFMTSEQQPFAVALAATRAGNIFTTHTPVEAGFDRFSPELVSRYLAKYADQLGIGLGGLLALGRQNPGNLQEPLNMAFMAMRGSGVVNGVSRLHGEVSRHIFQPLFPRWPKGEVPVTHVTNGVHMPSWDSAAADTLWTKACGKERWLNTLESLKDDFKKVTDEALWQLRLEQAQRLILYVRARLGRQLARAGASVQLIKQSSQLLDPDVLTMGFARRFTEYKRPNLLLHDPGRLSRILNHPDRPVQIVIAGKAHPRDEEGKALVRAWWEYSLRPDVQNRVIFLSDYDMALAEHLVRGMDLWINTPRRPWEACGTSGMKVLVNGGLNLSERDGWWAEGYRPEVGWAIGDGREHDADPNWDVQEAEQLYSVLENEVVPSFYDRDSSGIPRSWISRMRSSMAELTPQYSTNRMLREYVEKLYLPAQQEYLDRAINRGQKAIRLCQWRENIQKCWPQLHFGVLEINSGPGFHNFQIPVYPGNLNPDFIAVQLYADPENGEGPEIQTMIKDYKLSGMEEGYLFQAKVNTQRPAGHYTPRIVPDFEGAAVPLEANQILWYDISASGFSIKDF
jgi:glycogen phosphorylase